VVSTPFLKNWDILCDPGRSPQNVLFHRWGSTLDSEMRLGEFAQRNTRLSGVLVEGGGSNGLGHSSNSRNSGIVPSCEHESGANRNCAVGVMAVLVECGAQRHRNSSVSTCRHRGIGSRVTKRRALHARKIGRMSFARNGASIEVGPLT
jgi:hypothetical protein